MTDPYNIKWKRGDTIRRITDGKPFLVIDVATRLATIVVDLQVLSSPSTTLVILMKDYQNWALDSDMDLEVKKNERFEWNFNPITL